MPASKRLLLTPALLCPTLLLSHPAPANDAVPEAETEPENDSTEAVADADIVVVVGTAREPLVRPEMLRPGCHINSLGLETQGRRGVALEQFGGAVFCDHRGLAEAHGAAGNLGLPSGTELGEVLAGRAHGRTSAEQLTVFSHLGLPFQDLVAAWQVYQGAVDDEAITRLDFSA